jgi:hypothetical protein
MTLAPGDKGCGFVNLTVVSASCLSAKRFF